jgi:hypothetical protein
VKRCASAFAARLREITHGLITETGSPNPHVIATAVIERLSPGDYRDALSVCLADWVRSEVAQVGRRGRAVARGKQISTPDRIRAWYAQQLGTALFCGTAWKFLRDCSANDLHQAAADRYRKATETHAEGDRWTKVALFMEEHDRATVADIRQDELKTLMEAS